VADVGRPRIETSPLRLLLRLLTVISGVVDAVSFLGLGQVFTANMTGNVLLLGFAAAGASGFSAVAGVVSLLAFLIGAALSGLLYHREGGGRRWFLVEMVAESLLLAAAATIAFVAAVSETSDSRFLVILVLALAMGGRNATVRLLAIPEMTTTLMTAALTGLAIDSRLAGGTGVLTRTRLASVLAIVLGALIGALLVIHVGIELPLMLAALAQLVTTVVFARSEGSHELDRQRDERRSSTLATARSA
jgi:uncharacterized membrane protein YoaK (UPF0700 family)